MKEKLKAEVIFSSEKEEKEKLIGMVTKIMLVNIYATNATLEFEDSKDCLLASKNPPPWDHLLHLTQLQTISRNIFEKQNLILP